jgi:hypothetical protein
MLLQSLMVSTLLSHRHDRRHTSPVTSVSFQSIDHFGAHRIESVEVAVESSESFAA